MNMNSKEELLHFFLEGKIKLSQYDYNFMANLLSLIDKKNRITSNQASLFDRLLIKYKKQLANNMLDVNVLTLLDWQTPILASAVEYTSATANLEGDMLTLRVPFNKKFINMFNQKHRTIFTFDKERKVYVAKFSTTSFKILYDTLPKYFDTIRYDVELQAILDQIARYNNHIFDPILTEINGRLYVLACNHVLGNILNDINIHKDMETFFEMSKLAIKVDSKLYDNDFELDFAANRVFETDIDNIESVIRCMSKLNCENVLIGRGMKSSFNIDQLRTMISDHDMKSFLYQSLYKIPEGNTMLLQHISVVNDMVSSIVSGSWIGKVSKIVIFKNKNPIEVK